MQNKYKTLIITSWVVLIVCLIVKLLGGNWFELESENDKFIAFCHFVDNHMFIKMTLACIMYLASGYVIICTVLNEKYLSKKRLIVFIPLMITKSILGWYYYNISTIIDIFILLIIPTFINKNIKRNIICFLIINAFQLVSLGIRNLGFSNFNNNLFLIQTLMQIDYYVMIILFYLYNFREYRKVIKED